MQKFHFFHVYFKGNSQRVNQNDFPCCINRVQCRISISFSKESSAQCPIFNCHGPNIQLKGELGRKPALVPGRSLRQFSDILSFWFRTSQHPKLTVLTLCAVIKKSFFSFCRCQSFSYLRMKRPLLRIATFEEIDAVKNS